MHAIVIDNTYCSPCMTMKLIFLDNTFTLYETILVFVIDNTFFLSPRGHEASCLWKHTCFPYETLRVIYFDNTFVIRVRP